MIQQRLCRRYVVGPCCYLDFVQSLCHCLVGRCILLKFPMFDDLVAVTIVRSRFNPILNVVLHLCDMCVEVDIQRLLPLPLAIPLTVEFCRMINVSTMMFLSQCVQTSVDAFFL